MDAIERKSIWTVRVTDVYAISIVFFKVIYKFMEWSLHPEWTFEILSLQKQLSGRVL